MTARILLSLALVTGCSADSEPTEQVTSSTATTAAADTAEDRSLPMLVSPTDLTSNVDQDAILVSVNALVEDNLNLVETLTGRVAIHDATGAVTPSCIQPHDDRSVRVVPDEALADGWYELRLDFNGSGFRAEPTMYETNDAKFASRFRIGPGPVLQTVMYCDKKIQVRFSEALLLPRDGEPGQPVSVYADGTACEFQPLEVGAETLKYYQFLCPSEATEFRVVKTGVLSNGELTASLLRDDPQATEVVLDTAESYIFADCNYWHMP